MATHSSSSDSSTAAAAAPLFRRRLMRDIAELCTPPFYPNIRLHPPVDGPNGLMGRACLLLTTEAYGSMPLHLSVQFPDNYPVAPPSVSMDTRGITHPNVFGSYICASILNTSEGYSSAYTLRSVAIQLLSFFSSDSLEQVGGGVVSLDEFRKQRVGWGVEDEWDEGVLQQRRLEEEGAISRRQIWSCDRCCYDSSDPASMRKAAGMEEPEVECKVDEDGDIVMVEEEEDEEAVVVKMAEAPQAPLLPAAMTGRSIDALADDVLLLVLQELDVTALGALTEASTRVRQLVTLHDVLRQRELQCFCLKTSYMKSDLGIGVSTLSPTSYKPRLESEFDLLSREAFTTLQVRRSVQSIEFDHWLPLPLSRRHWLRVRKDVVAALVAIGEDMVPGGKKAYYSHETTPHRRQRQMQIEFEQQEQDLDQFHNGHPRGLQKRPAPTPPPSASLKRATEALLSFMTQIVVRLNEDVEKLDDDSRSSCRRRYYDGREVVKSSLRFASEKAIESYFHLFHLLVCLAAENPQVAADANRRIRSFYVDNRRSKADCPNLGMLLVAMLIVDDNVVGVASSSTSTSSTDNAGKKAGTGTREDLLKAIITEAITRNVVWLLDNRGAGHAELVHMEADNTVSEYRLHHTFVGSLTSYRLLMFMELFRRTARQSSSSSAASGGGDGEGGATLETIRDGLFQRHGAPPAGAAAHLAAEVRRLHAVRTWPDFLTAMGVTVPTKADFCNVLRRAVRESMRRGYSKWALTAVEAKSLRDYHEDGFDRDVARREPTRPTRGRGRGRGGSFYGRGRGHGRGGASRGASKTGDVWTVLSAQESVSAEYVQWRLQTGEVSFFPKK